MTKRKVDFTLALLPLLLAVAVAVELESGPTAEVKRQRIARAEYHRIPFDDMIKRHHLHDPNLKRLLRMSLQSFRGLVEILGPDLVVDESYAARRGGAICPSYCVFFALRYLAGARYQDIAELCQASPAAVYSCIHKTLISITERMAHLIQFPQTVDECTVVANGFTNRSYESAITNCVGAIDGYLMAIKVPSQAEVGNVKSYYSGHYARYGVNVQAVCDSECRFTFISVASPGSVNDRVAYTQSGVSEVVEQLPLDFAVIADAAYAPSEHCLPMYYGTSRNTPKYDNYNFFASQLRIQIEMAFGMMTRKWLILDLPINTTLSKAILIMHAISMLHNYCINERLKNNDSSEITHTDCNLQPTVQLNNVGDPIASQTEENVYRTHGHSVNREMIASSLAARNLCRIVDLDRVAGE